MHACRVPQMTFHRRRREVTDGRSESKAEKKTNKGEDVTQRPRQRNAHCHSDATVARWCERVGWWHAGASDDANLLGDEARQAEMRVRRRARSMTW